MEEGDVQKLHTRTESIVSFSIDMEEMLKLPRKGKLLLGSVLKHSIQEQPLAMNLKMVYSVQFNLN